MEVPNVVEDAKIQELTVDFEQQLERIGEKKLVFILNGLKRQEREYKCFEGWRR